MSAFSPVVETSLDRFFSPRSIAIVGASGTPGKIGAYPVHYQLRGGYQGRVFLINPGRDTIEGQRCYRDLRSVGEPIDLAIFAIASKEVEACIEDAIEAGVQNIVMFSAGFAEVDAEGAAVQARIAARVRAAGIRWLGPNCLGFLNVQQAVRATFTPVMMHSRVSAGSAAIVSQSGAFGVYAYLMACRRGLGLSHWITTGNEADIQVADCIEWLAHDPDTRVIMAYMEGCPDGPRFIRALQIARAAGKPVVITKVGRTSRGAEAAASHSAALAGDDAVFDAVLRQHGAWRVKSVEEFFNAGYILSYAPRPANPQLGVLTVSGGIGALMADDAALAGVEMPPMPNAAQAEIRQAVPFAAPANPVDITAQVIGQPALFERAAALMLEQGGYGCLLAFLAGGALTDMGWEVQQRMVRELRARYPDRALVMCGLSDPAKTRQLDLQGCVSFEDPSAAIAAIAALAYFAKQTPTEQALSAEARALSADVHCAEGEPLRCGTLNEYDSMALLRTHGVPVPQMAIVHCSQDAIAAAQRMGCPVVMKMLSSQITHKSEHQGVCLNLQSADQVAQAFEALRDRACALTQVGPFEGVLMAPMLRGEVECILGVVRDAQFGPIIVLGLGGVQAEVLKDVTMRAAPLHRSDAEAMVKELRGLPLLQGFRGQPACDVVALVDALLALSEFACQAGPTLASVDINPLLVRADGQGVIALDAVVRWDT